MIKKIGIISDSHDNFPKIKRAVEVFNEREVDLVIHAGDIISPFCAEEFLKLKCEFISIFGNNDGDKVALKQILQYRINEPPYFVKVHGLRILVIHNAEEILKVIELSDDYDFLIYGHSHKTDVHMAGKTLVVNPGEACGYLTGKSTIGILDVDLKEVEIIEI